jgi:hypothetical protein
MHQAYQMRHRAPEPIQPPDHQHVAWGTCWQRGTCAPEIPSSWKICVQPAVVRASSWRWSC